MLLWRENANAWNVLECISHLNLYSAFYVPQMLEKIKKSNSKPQKTFKSGWLGGYFANSMQPKDKLNKMNSMKSMNTLNVRVDNAVLDQFVGHQHALLEVLKLAQNVNLNDIKIKTSLSLLIRLKLGDSLLFYVNHNRRHFKQIERILAAQSH